MPTQTTYSKNYKISRLLGILLTVLLCALVILSCEKRRHIVRIEDFNADSTENDYGLAEYYPLNVGNYWRFRYFTISGGQYQPDESTFEKSVIDTAQYGGSTYFAINRKASGPSGVYYDTTDYYRMENDSLFMYSPDEDIIYWLPEMTAIKSHSPGDTLMELHDELNYTVDVFTLASKHYLCEIGIGTFSDCYAVKDSRWTYGASEPVLQLEVLKCYAPFIGLVFEKEIKYTSNGTEGYGIMLEYYELH